MEVQDVDALQAAALTEIHHPDAELDDDERKEQAELVSADDTGATALQWLIEPDARPAALSSTSRRSSPARPCSASSPPTVPRTRMRTRSTTTTMTLSVTSTETAR